MVEGTMSFQVSDDRAKLQVRGTSNMLLTALQVDELIQNLASVRSAMSPPVSVDFPVGTKVPQHNPCSHHVQINPHEKTLNLTIRSDAYGWISYAFRRDDIVKMLIFLDEQTARIQEAPKTPQ